MAEVKQILIEIDLKTGNVVGGTEQVNKQLQSLGTNAKLATTEINKVSAAMQKNMAGAAGIAGAAATELGRTISDLPFGISAVTNNISQLGNMFALLVVSAGGVNAAFRAMWTAIMGPVGLLIAFQAVVAGIELYSQSQRKAKKDTDDFKKSIDEINKSFTEQQAIFEALGRAAIYSPEAREALAKNMKEVKNFLDAAASVGDVTVEVIDEAVKLGMALLEARRNARLEEEKYLKIINDVKTTEVERIQAGTDLADALAEVERAEKALNLQKQEEIVVTTKVKKEKEEEIEVRERSIASLTREALTTIESFRNAYIQKRMLQEREARDDESFLEWKKSFFFRLSEDESFSFEERTSYYRQYVMANQQLGDLQLRNEEIRLKAMEQINLTYADSLATIFKTISGLAGENRFLQAVALLGESAAGIAKIVISTKAANAAAKLKYALLPGGQALAAAEIAANNFGAKVGIAANVASTAAALSKLKAPVSAPSTQTGGLAESGGGSIAPSFNIIGTTGQNQLAAAIAGTQQEPVKAYVVAGEITTAQSLERNIVTEASI